MTEGSSWGYGAQGIVVHRGSGAAVVIVATAAGVCWERVSSVGRAELVFASLPR